MDKHQLVVVLYAASDLRKAPVDALFTHLRIMQRLTFRGAQVQPLIEQVNVQQPGFSLASLLPRIRDQRAVVVLVVTPGLLTEEMLSARSDELANCEEAAVVPVYAVKVPSPHALPWSNRAWLPFAVKRTPIAISEMRNRDEASTEVVEGLACTITKHAEGDIQNPRRVEVAPATPNVPPSTFAFHAAARAPRRDDRERIPTLSVWVAKEDRDAVLRPVTELLTMLKRTRNVDAFTQWNIPAGANRELQFALAARAPHLLVVLSSAALADDRIQAVINNRRADQRLTVVLQRACMWELVQLDGATVLPQRSGSPITIAAAGGAGAWTQVGRHLINRIPSAIPERSGALTDEEEAIHQRFIAAPAVPRAQRGADYDLVRAYQEK